MRIYILIRELRRSKNISLRELEKLTGISKGHLSKIEREDVDPSLSTLVRIATALKVKVEELYKIERWKDDLFRHSRTNRKNKKGVA